MSLLVCYRPDSAYGYSTTDWWISGLGTTGVATLATPWPHGGAGSRLLLVATITLGEASSIGSKVRWILPWKSIHSWIGKYAIRHGFWWVGKKTWPTNQWVLPVFTKETVVFSRDLQSTIPKDYYFNGLWFPEIDGWHGMTIKTKQWKWTNMGVEPNIGGFYPQNGWLKIMEKPMNKWMMWGG